MLLSSFLTLIHIAECEIEANHLMLQIMVYSHRTKAKIDVVNNHKLVLIVLHQKVVSTFSNNKNEKRYFIRRKNRRTLIRHKFYAFFCSLL